MILAIVGTRHFSSPVALVYAELIISYEVWSGHWDGFVTGDADGIDKLVRRICDEADRNCQALEPENRCWEPRGYKARNIKVCETGDAMLCIRDPESTTYGSGWTANYMDTLGKAVTNVQIS